VKAEQNLTHGLQYILSYTWSKTIDIGCDGFFTVEGCAVQDAWHLGRERSAAGFDLTHVLSASWVYQLGSLRTGSKALNYALGNWQLNGIFTATSGLPYTLVISGDVANTGTGGNYERLNVVGNPSVSNPSPAQWFNKTAFAVPAPFTFGNLGRNALRGQKFCRHVQYREPSRLGLTGLQLQRPAVWQDPEHSQHGTAGPVRDEVPVLTGTHCSREVIHES
jgi:hypothetical protein